jgi:hypothetical protein
VRWGREVIKVTTVTKCGGCQSGGVRLVQENREEKKIFRGEIFDCRSQRVEEPFRFFSCLGFEEVKDLFKLKGGDADLQI